MFEFTFFVTQNGKLLISIPRMCDFIGKNGVNKVRREEPFLVNSTFFVFRFSGLTGPPQEIGDNQVNDLSLSSNMSPPDAGNAPPPTGVSVQDAMGASPTPVMLGLWHRSNVFVYIISHTSELSQVLACSEVQSSA